MKVGVVRRRARGGGMQPRVLHMLASLGLDARAVPASNVVFVRSSTEAKLYVAGSGATMPSDVIALR